MYTHKKTIAIVLTFLMLLAMIIYAVWNLQIAKADGPPDNPDQVECNDGSLVPMNADGTWECPVVQEQLPEEKIGRAIDCPDGQVGYVIDAEGTYHCPEPLIVPPGTRPGPDQVSPGDSHPYFDWSWFIDFLRKLFNFAW